MTTPICQILRGFHVLANKRHHPIALSVPRDAEPRCSLTVTVDLKYDWRISRDPNQNLFAEGFGDRATSPLCQDIAGLRKAHPKSVLFWRSLAPGTDHDEFLSWKLEPGSTRFQTFEEHRRPPSLAIKSVYSSGMTLELSIVNPEELPFLASPHENNLSYHQHAALCPEVTARLLFSELSFLPGELPGTAIFMDRLRSLTELPPGWTPGAIEYRAAEPDTQNWILSEPLEGDCAEYIKVGDATVHSPGTSARGRLVRFQRWDGCPEGNLVLDLPEAASQAQIKIPFDGLLVMTNEELEVEQARMNSQPDPKSLPSSWSLAARFKYKLASACQNVPILSMPSHFAMRDIRMNQETFGGPMVNRYRLRCSRILMTGATPCCPDKIVLVENQVVSEVLTEHLDSPGAVCIVDSTSLSLPVLKEELANLQVAFSKREESK